jgi:thiol-disulfide isomerase/thioredoxin
MINLDQKYFGLSLLTWIVIGIAIIYLCFCKKCQEDFTDSKSDVLKVYNFNTTWCGYSVRFQPIWDKFHKKMKSNKNIQVLDIKCDNQDDPKVKELCQRYGVEGFPTVIFAKGNKVVQYQDERTVEKLESTALSMIN